eukprot:g2007.t1
MDFRLIVSDVDERDEYEVADDLIKQAYEHSLKAIHDTTTHHNKEFLQVEKEEEEKIQQQEINLLPDLTTVSSNGNGDGQIFSGSETNRELRSRMEDHIREIKALTNSMQKSAIHEITLQEEKKQESMKQLDSYRKKIEDLEKLNDEKQELNTVLRHRVTGLEKELAFVQQNHTREINDFEQTRILLARRNYMMRWVLNMRNIRKRKKVLHQRCRVLLGKWKRSTLGGSFEHWKDVAVNRFDILSLQQKFIRRWLNRDIQRAFYKWGKVCKKLKIVAEEKWKVDIQQTVKRKVLFIIMRNKLHAIKMLVAKSFKRWHLQTKLTDAFTTWTDKSIFLREKKELRTLRGAFVQWRRTCDMAKIRKLVKIVELMRKRVLILEDESRATRHRYRAIRRNAAARQIAYHKRYMLTTLFQQWVSRANLQRRRRRLLSRLLLRKSKHTLASCIQIWQSLAFKHFVHELHFQHTNTTQGLRSKYQALIDRLTNKIHILESKQKDVENREAHQDKTVNNFANYIASLKEKRLCRQLMERWKMNTEKNIVRRKVATKLTKFFSSKMNKIKVMSYLKFNYVLWKYTVQMKRQSRDQVIEFCSRQLISQKKKYKLKVAYMKWEQQYHLFQSKIKHTFGKYRSLLVDGKRRCFMHWKDAWLERKEREAHLQMMKKEDLERERTMQRIMGHLRNNKLSRCFNGWKTNAQELKRQKHLAWGVLIRLRDGKLIPAFKTWHEFLLTEKHNEEVLRRFTARFQRLKVFRCWNSWIAFRDIQIQERKRLALEAEQNEVKLKKFVARWKNSSITRAFAQWSSKTKTLVRTRNVMARIYNKTKVGRMKSSIAFWFKTASESKIIKQKVSKLLMRGMRSTTYNTFNAWKAFKDTAKDRRTKIYRILLRAYRARLTFGLSILKRAVSADFVQRNQKLYSQNEDLQKQIQTLQVALENERREKATCRMYIEKNQAMFIKRMHENIQSHCMKRALHGWHKIVMVTRRIRLIVEHRLEKQSQGVKNRLFHRWKRTVDANKKAKHILETFLGNKRNRLIQFRFNLWHRMAVKQKRLKNRLKGIIESRLDIWLKHTLRGGFNGLRRNVDDHKTMQNNLRSLKIYFAGKETRLLARCVRMWSQNVREVVHIRQVLTNVRLRWTKKTFVRSLYRWKKFRDDRVTARNVLNKMYHSWKYGTIGAAFKCWNRTVHQALKEADRNHRDSLSMSLSQQQDLLLQLQKQNEALMAEKEKLRMKHIRHVMEMWDSNTIRKCFTKLKKIVDYQLNLKRRVLQKLFEHQHMSVMKYGFEKWEVETKRLRIQEMAAQQENDTLEKLKEMLGKRSASSKTTCFTTWRAFTKERLREKMLLNKVARRFQKRKLFSLFNTWHSWFTEVRENRAKLNRVIKYWTNKKKHRIFNTWYSTISEQIQERKQNAEMAKRSESLKRRVLMRIVKQQQSWCFDTWHTHTQERIRIREIGMKAAKRLQHQSTVQAIAQWKEWSESRIDLRKRLQKAVFMMQKSSYVKVMRAWVDFAQTRKRVRNVMKKAIFSVEHGAIARGFQSWKVAIQQMQIHEEHEKQISQMRQQIESDMLDVHNGYETRYAKLEEEYHALQGELQVVKEQAKEETEKLSKLLFEARSKSTERAELTARSILLKLVKQEQSFAFTHWRQVTVKLREQEIAKKAREEAEQRLQTSLQNSNSEMDTIRARLLKSTVAKWHNMKLLKRFNTWKALWTQSRRNRKILKKAAYILSGRKTELYISGWRRLVKVRKVQRRAIERILGRKKTKSLKTALTLWREGGSHVYRSRKLCRKVFQRWYGMQVRDAFQKLVRVCALHGFKRLQRQTFDVEERKLRRLQHRLDLEIEKRVNVHQKYKHLVLKSTTEKVKNRVLSDWKSSHLRKQRMYWVTHAYFQRLKVRYFLRWTRSHFKQKVDVCKRKEQTAMRNSYYQMKVSRLQEMKVVKKKQQLGARLICKWLLRVTPRVRKTSAFRLWVWVATVLARNPLSISLRAQEPNLMRVQEPKSLTSSPSPLSPILPVTATTMTTKHENGRSSGDKKSKAFRNLFTRKSMAAEVLIQQYERAELAVAFSTWSNKVRRMKFEEDRFNKRLQLSKTKRPSFARNRNGRPRAWQNLAEKHRRWGPRRYQDRASSYANKHLQKSNTSSRTTSRRNSFHTPSRNKHRAILASQDIVTLSSQLQDVMQESLDLSDRLTMADLSMSPDSIRKIRMKIKQ